MKVFLSHSTSWILPISFMEMYAIMSRAEDDFEVTVS